MSKAKYKVQFFSPSKLRWRASAFSDGFYGESLAKLVKAVGSADNGFKYRIRLGKKVIRQFEPRS